MKATLLAIGQWFEERLSLRESLLPMLRHPVPRGSADSRGWWYVFGSATLTFLMLQVLTGIFLAMVYVPSTDQAYESLEYLNYVQPLGWFVRALHFWSANAMVVMLILHMVQVFLFGAYKYPRELTWIVGVILFALTLGMGYSGQVLRWDADAYWGVGVGAAIAGRVPFFGPESVRGLLGGPIIGAATLSRFFALHVFILPGMLFFFLAIHLHLVMKRGISEPPVPGKPVDPATYHIEYEKELAQGVPFFPDAFYRDGTFAFASILVVVMLALWFGPFGPNDLPDPTLIQVNPRPEWYFLPLFGIASLCPAGLEDVGLLVLPPVLFLMLMLVPLVAGKGERAPSRRPVAVLTVVVTLLVLGVFGWLGHTAPWSPEMDAWSGAPVPPKLLEGRTPLEMQGAAVLQYKNCRNCHALEGSGGKRGPDLTSVGDRLSQGQLVRQVQQGSEQVGGDMPAYGKQLGPHQTAALVAYLQSLKSRP